MVVLDLVKQHERRPRESLIGTEYREAINTINSQIPSLRNQIRYCALDFSKLSKSKGGTAKASRKGGNGVEVDTNPPKKYGMAAIGNEWANIEKSLSQKEAGRPSTDAVANASEQEKKFKDAEDKSTPTGRLDVLRELDDIAKHVMGETQLFCRYLVSCCCWYHAYD